MATPSWPTRNTNLVWAATCWFLLAAVSHAGAHPLSQGSLNVVVYPDRVTARARVTFEEVSVTQMVSSASTIHGLQTTSTDSPMVRACKWHAAYLSTHLRFSLADVPLVGRVVTVTPPSVGGAAATGDKRPEYDLEYALPPAVTAKLAHRLSADLVIRSSVLTDANFLPGTTWEASYIVRIGQPGRSASEGLLLTGGHPIEFTVDRTPAALAAAAGQEQVGPSNVNRWKLVKEYLWHGVHHILTGYDHLLFISALVLASKTVWDLVKVVTAFTVAHTVTLTLAALKLVHLPSEVVEPFIAGSIVFVAVQNVFWPGVSRGAGRTVVAFFFGLFHGLGFAGGLLEAMQDMHGATIVLAIAAFSIGVELGHQMIVLPLFAALTLMRQSRDSGPSRERVSLVAQRFGSAAISLAGMFYLVVALSMSFSSGATP